MSFRRRWLRWRLRWAASAIVRAPLALVYLLAATDIGPFRSSNRRTEAWLLSTLSAPQIPSSEGIWGRFVRAIYAGQVVGHVSVSEDGAQAVWSPVGGQDSDGWKQLVVDLHQPSPVLWSRRVGVRRAVVVLKLDAGTEAWFLGRRTNRVLMRLTGLDD